MVPESCLLSARNTASGGRSPRGSIEQRRHKALVFRRGQRQHGKAMLKVRELAPLLVRRQIGRDEIHAGEIKLLGGRASYGQMAEMHRIERPAEETDLHAAICSSFF